MKNDKELLNDFLERYHSRMNGFRMAAIYPKEYIIYISKCKKDEKYQNIRISVIKNFENAGQVYIDTNILPNELVLSAINEIRNDFRDNHEITCARISGDTKYQFLENTNFVLKIAIDSNEELEEARKYNYEINIKPDRTALMRTRTK